MHAKAAASKATACQPLRQPRHLQAIGLAVLMAKAGLAVPAAHPARLPPFSSVLADIGDEQSLMSSLSTFSGHLHQIQAPPLPPRVGCCTALPAATGPEWSYSLQRWPTLRMSPATAFRRLQLPKATSDTPFS